MPKYLILLRINLILPRLITILEAFEEATKTSSVQAKPSLHFTVTLYCALHVFLDQINSSISSCNTSYIVSEMIEYLIDALKRALDRKYLEFHRYELAAFILDPGNLHPKNQYGANLVEKAFNEVMEILRMENDCDKNEMNPEILEHVLHQQPRLR